VRLAESKRDELTGAFIRTHMVGHLLSDAKLYERKLSREERKELETQAIRIRFESEH